jgi:CRP-like cAMP-binding protein
MDEAVLDRLKAIPLFADIRDNEEALRLLVATCKKREVAAGKVMIKEGEVGSEMFIVYDGSVEIRKRTRAGDDYTVVLLSATQNVFFGELALIDDDKRSATVIATEDSSFLVIDKEDFLKLGNERPDIGLPITRNISRILATRLRKTTDDMLTIFDALVNELEGV